MVSQIKFRIYIRQVQQTIGSISTNGLQLT